MHGQARQISDSLKCLMHLNACVSSSDGVSWPVCSGLGCFSPFSSSWPVAKQSSSVTVNVIIFKIILAVDGSSLNVLYTECVFKLNVKI